MRFVIDKSEKEVKSGEIEKILFFFPCVIRFERELHHHILFRSRHSLAIFLVNGIIGRMIPKTSIRFVCFSTMVRMLLE